jgi:hypothetical protein
LPGGRRCARPRAYCVIRVVQQSTIPYPLVVVVVVPSSPYDPPLHSTQQRQALQPHAGSMRLGAVGQPPVIITLPLHLPSNLLICVAIYVPRSDTSVSLNCATYITANREFQNGLSLATIPNIKSVVIVKTQ